MRVPAAPAMTNSASSASAGAPEVAGRVGVRERAAQRAAVADLVVGDRLGGLGQQLDVLR